MNTEELAVASTAAEARAAFVSRAGGPALEAGTLLDRAAQSLPGVVHPASDVETALTALAAHAASPPAPAAPAVWGLDLATGALRRVPVPAPGLSAGVAAGLTWVSALEAGLAQHCEALLAQRLAAPGTRVPRLCLDRLARPGCGAGESCLVPPGLDLAEDGHAAPDALVRALRSGEEPVAHDLSGLLCLPACALRLDPDSGTDTGPDAHPDASEGPAPSPGTAVDTDVDTDLDTDPDLARERNGGGDRGTVVATGTSLVAAFRTAAGRALAHRRARPSGRPGAHTVPAIGREQELVAARPPSVAHWSRPLDALRAQGHRPVAVLLNHDAEVSEVLPYLVRIVLMAE
ncbi:hypothetical protein [Streptomyces sp. NPDC093707]|uniref:hypothetical protein n=1 Tax=Streptomyces sp. NPDC093707 TaxID=3154984 RepID=UPI00344CF104